MNDDLEYLNNLIDQGSESKGEVEVEMALLALCMRKNSAILETVENRINVYEAQIIGENGQIFAF